ncbi:MAG: 30S ribosomal protein S6, partial [Dehalococcoidia bacterium]
MAKNGGYCLRDYELVVVISPEVAEEEIPGTLEKIGRFITERGGSITEVNQWGRRKLAYPIKNFM